MSEPIISQEANFDILEKLEDGSYKLKHPRTKAENIIDLARYATTTGSANTYVANISGISNLVAGLRVTIKINVANIGASTLNVSGLGAKSIRKSGGTTLSSGNLKAGGVYTLVYDGTNFQLQGEGGEYGTALASDVRAGKTIGTEEGLKTGTLSENTIKEIITTEGGQINISPGIILPGSYVKAQFANLVASNIKSGVNVGGVVGSLVDLGLNTGSMVMVKGEYNYVRCGFKPIVVFVKESMRDSSWVFVDGITERARSLGGGASVANFISQSLGFQFMPWGEGSASWIAIGKLDVDILKDS